MIKIFKFKSFLTGKKVRAIIIGDKEAVKYITGKTYESPRGHGY